MNEKMISLEEVEQILRKLVTVYINFPYSKVCVHWAALQVLEVMQVLGIFVSDELANAIVCADDNLALSLLKNKIDVSS